MRANLDLDAKDFLGGGLSMGLFGVTDGIQNIYAVQSTATF